MDAHWSFHFICAMLYEFPHRVSSDDLAVVNQESGCVNLLILLQVHYFYGDPNVECGLLNILPTSPDMQQVLCVWPQSILNRRT